MVDLPIQPKIIGITGCSGSGKSTFLNYLLQSIGSSICTVFSQDNYYIKRESQPLDANGIHNFDLPNSLDLQTFYSDLKTLKENRSVILNTYHYNSPTLKSSEKLVQSNKFVLVDGLFLFHEPSHLPLFDFKIFIEASEDVNFNRRLKRDSEERGYGFEDVNYRFKNHVLPSYHQYILPHKDKCDFVVQNRHQDFSTLSSLAEKIALRIL